MPSCSPGNEFRSTTNLPTRRPGIRQVPLTISETPVLRLAEAADLVLGWWSEDLAGDLMNRQTYLTYSLVVRRLVDFAKAHEVTDLNGVTQALIAKFLEARTTNSAGVIILPTVASKHVRRATLRLFYAILRDHGLTTADPARDIPLSRVDPSITRPLTVDEANQLRYYMGGFKSARMNAVVAFALAGMSVGELLGLERTHIDPTGSRVWAAGSDQRDARWLTLDAWGTERAQRFVGECTHDGPVFLRKAKHNTAILASPMRQALDRAGLGQITEVRPASMSYHAALLVFEESGRIEEAARVLGLTSLDSMARILGYEWRPQDTDPEHCPPAGCGNSSSVR